MFYFKTLSSTYILKFSYQPKQLCYGLIKDCFYSNLESLHSDEFYSENNIRII